MESAWYELIAQQKLNDIRQSVKCDHFASAVSLQELGEVKVSCLVPMVAMSYEVTHRDTGVVKTGGCDFGPAGVESFLFQDALDLEVLRPYETEDHAHRLQITVKLITGQEVCGVFAFCATLCPSESTRQLPPDALADRLAAIPIAKAGMTEEELRSICLRYMQLQVEVPIQFEEDFCYEIYSQRKPRRLLGGHIYGGIPYVTRGAGNLYRLAEICDPETHCLDRSSDIFDDIRYFGVACSGAASTAWGRVVTSAYLGYTMFMTEANGFLPVGPYRYPKENVVKFTADELSCAHICAFNGEQTMLESYACLKPADGAVCPGHVRMNAAVPVVIRKADGTIDPDESYTLMAEQVCYVSNPDHIRKAPDGTHYLAQGRVAYKYTFRELFDTNYIPFSFAEFADPSRVAPARVRLAVEPTLAERVLTANYSISDVFLELNGKRYPYRNMEFFRKEVKLGDIFPEELLTPDARIFCRILNGELVEVEK